MQKTLDQWVEETLCGRGYERLVIKKNGNGGRVRFRKRLSEALSVDITANGDSELYGVEYAVSTPSRGGKTVTVSNLHSVDAATVVRRVDEYEQLIKDLNNKGE